MKAWDLFNNMFKPGDEVIVLDSDDYFHWGVMTWTETKCVLSNPRGGKQKELDWDDVRFVAHEGFPIRKLKGADGSKLIETLDTTDVQRFLRELTATGLCKECSVQVEENKESYRGKYGLVSKPELGMMKYYLCKKCRGEKTTSRATIGDPYMLEDFSYRLLNPGNWWPTDDWWTKWQWDWEEVMVMNHVGGASGLLWDIPTIYCFE